MEQNHGDIFALDGVIRSEFAARISADQTGLCRPSDGCCIPLVLRHIRELSRIRHCRSARDVVQDLCELRTGYLAMNAKVDTGHACHIALVIDIVNLRGSPEACVYIVVRQNLFLCHAGLILRQRVICGECNQARILHPIDKVHVIYDMTVHVVYRCAEILRAVAAGIIPCDVYAGPIQAILDIVPHVVAGFTDNHGCIDAELAAQQLQGTGIALAHRTYRLAGAAQNRTRRRPRRTGYVLLVFFHASIYCVIIVRIIVTQPSIQKIQLLIGGLISRCLLGDFVHLAVQRLLFIGLKSLAESRRNIYRNLVFSLSQRITHIRKTVGVKHLRTITVDAAIYEPAYIHREIVQHLMIVILADAELRTLRNGKRNAQLSFAGVVIAEDGTAGALLQIFLPKL